MAVEPTPEQIAALAARPADEPAVMVNRRDRPLCREVTVCGDRRGREALVGCHSRGGVSDACGILDMVTNEDFGKVHEYREIALDRGDLIATSNWTMAE